MDVLMMIYNLVDNDLELYKKSDDSYLLYEEDNLHYNLVKSTPYENLEKWFADFKDKLGKDRWIDYSPKYIDSNLCDFIRKKVSQHPYFANFGQGLSLAQKTKDKKQLKEWLHIVKCGSFRPMADKMDNYNLEALLE
ncbi:hypothetical protein [Membranihabitans marinus]|uniref:hypothetical protein n=1 Tax=Membranihabitans marinus TaxID=1227546 RepID=UPI001F24457D|nr:hypothetical protein [Membranihabitans marinus]